MNRRPPYIPELAGRARKDRRRRTKWLARGITDTERAETWNNWIDAHEGDTAAVLATLCVLVERIVSGEELP